MPLVNIERNENEARKPPHSKTNKTPVKLSEQTIQGNHSISYSLSYREGDKRAII